jgi:mono/diheme cytochrome c family protein
MRLIPLLAATLIGSAGPALAETPRDFLTRFEKEAGSAASAERGARFFTTRHGGEWSCASCHTERPTQAGRHAKTDKPITALAPAANAERFTDAAKVDKWFRRNCNDTLNRACSAQEKADVLAWLLSLK